jgi:hypothetical protein
MGFAGVVAQGVAVGHGRDPRLRPRPRPLPTRRWT